MYEVTYWRNGREFVSAAASSADVETAVKNAAALFLQNTTDRVAVTSLYTDETVCEFYPRCTWSV